MSLEWQRVQSAALVSSAARQRSRSRSASQYNPPSISMGSSQIGCGLLSSFASSVSVSKEPIGSEAPSAGSVAAAGGDDAEPMHPTTPLPTTPTCAVVLEPASLPCASP